MDCPAYLPAIQNDNNGEGVDGCRHTARVSADLHLVLTLITSRRANHLLGRDVGVIVRFGETLTILGMHALLRLNSRTHLIRL